MITFVCAELYTDVKGIDETDLEVRPCSGKAVEDGIEETYQDSGCLHRNL